MLYAENENSKTLISPEYTWFLDKNSGIALSWGVTKEDDPQWSRWSPEIVVARMGKDYKCNMDLWNRLLNVKHDQDPPMKYKDGFISSIYCIEVDAPDGLVEEIVKTMKWLRERELLVILKQKQSQIDMRSVTSMKMQSVDFVDVEAENLSTLRSALDLLILENITTKVQIENKEKSEIML